jgi:hypothetical protein
MMPGYAEVRWGARLFALAGLGTVLYLQYRRNTPPMVDRMLVVLAVVMFAITVAPARRRRPSAARRVY